MNRFKKTKYLLPVIDACSKMLCQIRKHQVRGLRSQKKRSLLFANEHFFGKCNEEIGAFLLILIFPVLLFSCSKDKDNSEIGNPTVKFTSGEYKVKKSKEVTLTASVENALNPIYSWKLDGKIISDSLNCHFSGDNVGEYFVTFRVDAENGSVEEQVKVSVLDKLPPEINMASSLVAYSGQATELVADAQYADDATYVWRLNGQIVCETKNYVFNQTTLGTQTLTVKVTNEDGQDLKVLSITVLPQPLPELFFDDGHYRVTSNLTATRKMTVPLGKSLVLAPVICNIKSPVSFEWTVNGAQQSSTTEYFTFTPTIKGSYLVTVKETGTSATATVQVDCVDPEGAFFRAIVSGNKATATKAFDYIPAPGQFINYQTGTTKTRALQDLQNALNSGSAPYVGAYGGYFIVGFDHSVENKADKADLRITGNAFAGWSEPGIVWVMQDENGNGLADDTWYELKGSESGRPETKLRYAITYYKPQAAASNVLWTDNMGRTGSVDYNGYHTQAYYFPMFISESYYTLSGTCLASTMEIGSIETSTGYAWGYVDNFGDGSRPDFWLEDAIKADGTPADLKYIDFVKVHTGMTGKGAAVGEISTEAGIPTDLNFQ